MLTPTKIRQLRQGRGKKALDLFCGAGGASMGISRCGYEIVGVDVSPQPHYPFRFVCADAMTFPLDGFDLIWASPPCQAFTVYRNNHKRVRRNHPDLVAATRQRLIHTGTPYIIENVPGAPLHRPLLLCGTSFLELEVRRHRLFECSFPVTPRPCNHARLTRRKYPGSSNRPNGRTVCNVGEWRVPIDQQRAAMGINWMTMAELSQAVPPVYAEYIVRQLNGTRS